MHDIDETRILQALTTVEGQDALWIAGHDFIRYEVVGEAFNPEQMARVAAATHGRFDVPLVAWLVPEPQNPHDRNAIIVWVLGGKTGYLPKELAARWRPVLDRLRHRHGRAIACRAALDPPSIANQGGYGIVVWLPLLDAFLPAPISAQAPQPSTSRSPSPTFAAPPSQRRAPPPLPTNAPLSRSPLSTPQPAAVSVTPSPASVAQPSPPLDEQLAATKAALEAAKKELESVEESLDIQSFGFYRTRYGFESSREYMARLGSIREEQKAFIKAGKAAPCETTWTVGGSAAEGKRMVKQQAKLMLRAFNGECDAAIAKVRYDNVTKLEERMTKAYAEINKLGEVQQVYIARRYFDLKLAELHLVHEHREKVQEEKEEQKRLREQMREEQKVEEEIARAKADAERDEAQKTVALEKARADLEAAAATTKQHERLEALVNKLETELKDAIDRKAKAIARAQLTRSGHVYVLSNVGSFGEGVYKIGLTRRLDPQERVDELGDASVPFPFDVHAVIFSEDAPTLETSLHKIFAERRVNLVNRRKEYFRVSLDEIRTEVHKLHGLVTFVVEHQAEEYRKSVVAMSAPQLGADLAAINAS